jgi:glycerol uptake facilitator protein
LSNPILPKEEKMVSFSLGQRALSETLGTALLVFVGAGSVVATLVLAGDSTPAITGSDLLGISFAFGLILTVLVYALGKVSGCHINPAVTFALAVTKRFPWREVPTYWGAQLVGGVLGALGIWAVFA